MPTKRKAIPLDEVSEPVRCKARNKVCRNPNGCQYRYKRGDKAMECPVCHFDRQCKNTSVSNYPVCRMHGANVGRVPKRGKYFVAKKISEDYNRIMNSDDLVSVATEIALLGARTSELQVHIDSVEKGVSIRMIEDAIRVLESANAMNGEPGRLQRGISMLVAAMTPLVLEQQAWGEIRQNITIHQKLVDSEREWLIRNSGVITPGQFVELVSWILELCMVYIPNPSDRLRFYKQASQVLPGSPNANQPKLSPSRTKEMGDREEEVTIDAVAKVVS